MVFALEVVGFVAVAVVVEAIVEGVREVPLEYLEREDWERKAEGRSGRVPLVVIVAV